MNLYENLFILDPALDDKVKEEQIAKVSSLITENGGEILKTTNLGTRKLAYAIRKQEKGEYILIVFNAPSPTIAKLERLSKLAEPILKFMFIKIEKKKHIASVIAAINKEAAAAAEPAESAPAETTAEPAETAPEATTEPAAAPTETTPETTEETKEDVQ